MPAVWKNASLNLKEIDMKKTLTLIIFACLLAFVPAMAQQKGGKAHGTGIGPVMKVSYGSDTSRLPATAQSFIKKIFPGTDVSEVEFKAQKGEYEVEMANGYEVKFNTQGNWTEIEAPEGTQLSGAAINQLMPENVVVETLRGDAVVPGGIINYIEEVAYVPDYGYIVEFAAQGQPSSKVLIDKATGKTSATQPAARRPAGKVAAAKAKAKPAAACSQGSAAKGTKCSTAAKTGKATKTTSTK